MSFENLLTTTGTVKKADHPPKKHLTTLANDDPFRVLKVCGFS